MSRPWLVLSASAAVACGSHSSATTDAPLAPDAAVDALTCTASETMCGDTCVDLAIDLNHCGACSHACGCGSTSCSAGLCASHVIASDQGAPVELAIHDGQLYWGTDASRTVSTAELATGTVRVMFPGRTAVRGFAFDATRIYFSRAAFNIVESGTLNGSSSGNFTNHREPGAAGVAADDKAAYWATYDGGTAGLIRTKPLGPPSTVDGSTLVSGLTSPDGVAVDATHIYFTTHTQTGGTVQRVVKAGGTPTVLASNQAAPHSLAVADGFVYWTDQGDGTPNTGSVQRVAVTGGPIQILADHQPFPNTLALQGGDVYWTDTVAGTVMRVPIAGGAVAPVVAGEDHPLGLVTTASCMYFTDFADGGAGGSVRGHDLD
jgi:hypothetical protein